jgi:hypothetical protein
MEKKENVINKSYIERVEDLSRKLSSRIEVGVTQTDYNVYVYIVGLNDTDGSLSQSISGHGLTYADACEDYIDKLQKANCLMCNRMMVIV